MKTKLFLILMLSITGVNIKNSNAQTWSAVGSGLNYSVNTFAIYNGNLYAGCDGIYKWDGSNWTGMNTGTSTFGGGTVYSLAVSNGGNFYCGGADFFVLTPDNNLYNYIGRWNGSQWTTVGSGTVNDGAGMGGYVVAMTSYNGQLYAGGDFGTAGGDPLNQFEAYYIASFAGTTCCWSAVGSGMNERVRELIVDTINNELYAGGYFTTAGGISANYIAKWNGASWSALGTGTDGKVTALCMHNGEIYAGGLFTTAGGSSASNIAKWNGSSWSALGSGLDGQVYDLVSHNGDLYAGGAGFTVGGNTQYIAKWNGTNWTALSSGVDNYVNKLTVFNNELYVGGGFLNAGGIPANHVAKWNEPNGINETHSNYTIDISPNPSTGKFTIENKGDLNIYNLLGEKIFSQKLTLPKTEIDFSSQPKGIYFVKLVVNPSAAGSIYSNDGIGQKIFAGKIIID